MKTYCLSLLLILIGVTKSFGETSPRLIEPIAGNFIHENACDTILIDQDGVPVRIIGSIDKVKADGLRIQFCERRFIKSFKYEQIISINSVPISTWIASMQPKSKRFVKVVLQDGTKYEGELLVETDKAISLRTYEGDSLKVQIADVENISPQEFNLLLVKKKNQKIKRVIRNGEGTGFWLKESIKMKRGILQNINPASLDVGRGTYQLHQLESFSSGRYKSDMRVLLIILSGLILTGAYMALLIIGIFTLLSERPSDLRWLTLFGVMGLPLILIQFPLKFSFKKYDFVAVPKDQNWEKGMHFNQID